MAWIFGPVSFPLLPLVFPAVCLVRRGVSTIPAYSRCCSRNSISSSSGDEGGRGDVGPVAIICNRVLSTKFRNASHVWVTTHYSSAVTITTIAALQTTPAAEAATLNAGQAETSVKAAGADNSWSFKPLVDCELAFFEVRLRYEMSAGGRDGGTNVANRMVHERALATWDGKTEEHYSRLWPDEGICIACYSAKPPTEAKRKCFSAVVYGTGPNDVLHCKRERRGFLAEGNMARDMHTKHLLYAQHDIYVTRLESNWHMLLTNILSNWR